MARSKTEASDLFFVPLILFMAVYFSTYGSHNFADLIDQRQDAPSGASAEEKAADSSEGWFEIKSRYFTIYCEEATNINLIGRRLGRRALFTSGIYKPNPVSAPPQKVAYRMDMLLERVEEMLDMYPNLGRINVKIFKDRKELNAEYSKIFGVHADYKSFYIHKYSTIYASETDISDSVMAHEMAHAVIDNYFSGLPPEKIG